MKFHFVSSQAPEAIEAAQQLKHKFGQTPRNEADVIVALGGDGLMLETVHTVVDSGQAIFGMNRGSVGFLMNDYQVDSLPERIAAATETVIHPLKMVATDRQGKAHSAFAFNEVSMLRQQHQAAKLRISIDAKVRLDELICDDNRGMPSCFDIQPFRPWPHSSDQFPATGPDPDQPVSSTALAWRHPLP